MVLTSATGGLAHYCAHLWAPLAEYVRPLYVTFRDEAVDDLVRDRVDGIFQLLDPEDPRTIADVVSLARRHGVRHANLHSGTRTKLDFGYYLALLHALRDAGIACVLHLHDVVIYRAGAHDLEAAVGLSRSSDSILVGSVREMEVLQCALGSGHVPIALMHHGPYDMMDSGRFDRAGAREHLGLEHDARIVLFFGSLRGEKRLEDLLEAFSCVVQARPNAVLVVQTDLRYAAGLASGLDPLALGRHLRLRTGYASMPEVEALFKAADVVALPYDRVAASGVLNLARAFARPVVLTDRFELAPVIDSVCGYRVPARDPGALAAALIRVLELSDEQRRGLGQGWAEILETETWARAATMLWRACQGRPWAPESGRPRLVRENVFELD
jgi:glycosyltransferase involved in cell wall biosynthesis